MMQVVIVSYDEAEAVIYQKQSEGLILASASNAGLVRGKQVRLTFLTKEVLVKPEVSQ
ncbi:hypothetical protein [Sinorhizobium meliloti]|uniref:hypothetical protein n=1 Tax=Rhizobium meliloti TaxID=382 RepID=UPI001297C2F3|nr:hypothetical protein [Sinorhizobium meliloti]MQW26304.1 hypothetical protein [Sinorhizobium meliloti]